MDRVRVEAASGARVFCFMAVGVVLGYHYGLTVLVGNRA
jgi:hypothetical protein